MKVSELIEKLKNVPQDYDIRISVCDEEKGYVAHDFENDIEIEVFEGDSIVEICGL